MAPGGAHPRCALGWKRLGAPSASAPRGEPEQRCWWTCRPGTTSTWRVGLSGTFRSRLRSRPAREGRPSSRRILANRLRPESVRSLLLPAYTRVGSPTLGTSRRRSCTTPRGRTPGGAEDLGPGPLRGASACVEWADLIAPREEASEASLSCHSALLFGPREPDRGESSGARLPGVRHLRPKADGGSPSRPVAAAPFSSVRHVALAGRAGSVRRLRGGGRIWLLL